MSPLRSQLRKQTHQVRHWRRTTLIRCVLMAGLGPMIYRKAYLEISLYTLNRSKSLQMSKSFIANESELYV
jgi:hypothetical protein